MYPIQVYLQKLSTTKLFKGRIKAPRQQSRHHRPKCEKYVDRDEHSVKMSEQHIVQHLIPKTTTFHQKRGTCVCMLSPATGFTPSVAPPYTQRLPSLFHLREVVSSLTSMSRFQYTRNHRTASLKCGSSLSTPETHA